MRRVLILTIAVVLLVLVAAGSVGGIAYWVTARRFVSGQAHAVDGIVRAPVVFLAGAVTDAVALLPMLLPSFAALLWGLCDVSDSYRLAMRCAASLMFGWTLLLVWAFRRPLERCFVAPLTVLVVGGIVVSEIAGAAVGVVDSWRVVPTWCLQAFLLVLFSWATYAGRQASRARQVLP